MAAAFQLPNVQSHHLLHKSTFLGKTSNINHRFSLPVPNQKSSFNVMCPSAKFDLFEILGGRGLCNGEEGVEKELKKFASEEKEEKDPSSTADENQEISSGVVVPEDGFEKELMGLTGGFPGGETGLQKFIEKNPPPPPPPPPPKKSEAYAGFDLVKKSKPPELPMLLPGMIVIVKNPNNPFYMYSGIVQRITDGKAGVLFEGGNWDRLITFRLDELERREKGPPMVNPKSAVLETIIENSNTT